METFTIVLYVIGIIIGWIIFYYVVKAAVRNGIIEAQIYNQVPPIAKNSKPEKPANAAQVRLQQQYDNGEITFETYQSEWNKQQQLDGHIL